MGASGGGQPPRGAPIDANAAPARAPAAPGVLARVPQELKDATYQGYVMRHAQACHLAEWSTGRDFIGVAATAAGKSLSLFLPAAARALAARREGRLADVEPIDVILAPFANAAVSLQAEGNSFLERVALSQTPPWQPERYSRRVLYVERDSTGALPRSRASGAPTPAPRAADARLCPGGHPLVWHSDERVHRTLARAATCDQCGEDLARSDERGHCAKCDYDVCRACASGRQRPPSGGSASGVAPSGAGEGTPSSPASRGLPAALPCGWCAVCFGDAARRYRYRCA